MKRDCPDFFYVEPQQLAIHARLENWSRYVEPLRLSWKQASIWKLGRSNGRQWHQPELRVAVDTLDGHNVEKAVCALPPPHRDALRWNYVWKSSPRTARQILGTTDTGVLRLVVDGRAMLINRRV